MILTSVRRAADLTKKLLLFSRKGAIVSTVVDLHRIIDDSSDIFYRTLDKKIKISVNKNAVNCYAAGDASALQNAILNIGINASHAMPNGGG